MKHIVIFENISSELRSRSVARKIFSNLATSQGSNVSFVLDFNNITMISRSFADEIFEFVDFIGKARVLMINDNENISLTLKIVNKNRNNKRNFEETGDSTSFDDIESLKNFMLSM